MYLVAHQDECQMVVGTPKVGTVTRIYSILQDKYVDCIVGTQQPRQCTCEPQTIHLATRAGDDSIPGLYIPRWYLAP